MFNRCPRNWFALLVSVLATVQPACNTKAVGVDECRRIEYARCEVASNCPDEFSVTDVEQCRTFYRDHCLHGLPGAVPKSSAVNECVEAIQKLGGCAAEKDGPGSPIAECGESGVKSTKPKVTTVCKLLAQPESIEACSFLDVDYTGAGGQGGGAGTSSIGGSAVGGSAQGGTAAGGSDASAEGGDLTDLLSFGGFTL